MDLLPPKISGEQEVRSLTSCWSAHPPFDLVAVRVESRAGQGSCFFVLENRAGRIKKFEYNAAHPYTFAVSLLSYVYFRNCSQRLRGYNLDLLVQMGKVTLET